MLDRPPVRTLVLGVGNLLLSDEGVGVRVLERLAETFNLPEGVQALDGGTLGLDLLYHLADADGRPVENLLIVDAVEMGKEPGTLLRLEGDEVPAFLSVKISPHQIGIPDMLFAAKLKDIYPPNVVLWGVQPGTLEVGLDLSPPVAAQVDVLVAKAVAELARWGEDLTPK
ncbi:MAG: HyaD/HybD family hydrogenase maturation endopeptidase [Chloroflexi bacterium]|nr:HyaD/HybD family hydrogenase maturation endopeptidase [Chloroflexota bacterium]